MVPERLGHKTCIGECKPRQHHEATLAFSSCFQILTLISSAYNLWSLVPCASNRGDVGSARRPRVTRRSVRYSAPTAPSAPRFSPPASVPTAQARGFPASAWPPAAGGSQRGAPVLSGRRSSRANQTHGGRQQRCTAALPCQNQTRSPPPAVT